MVAVMTEKGEAKVARGAKKTRPNQRKNSWVYRDLPVYVYRNVHYDDVTYSVQRVQRRGPNTVREVLFHSDSVVVADASFLRTTNRGQTVTVGASGTLVSSIQDVMTLLPSFEGATRIFYDDTRAVFVNEQNQVVDAASFVMLSRAADGTGEVRYIP